MANQKKPKIEDSAVTHKKCVYADQEFIGRATALASRLGINEDNPIERIKLGDEHYFVVGKNAEKIASKMEASQLEKLAAEFAIEISDVIAYLNRGHEGLIYEYMEPPVRVEFWPTEGITIKVPPNATKRDVIDQWPRVKMLRNIFEGRRKVTKRKPPENYKLIYAIFRARSKGMRFEDIFNLYKDDKLPLYSGSSRPHTNEDSLERYYRKYKPKADI